MVILLDLPHLGPAHYLQPPLLLLSLATSHLAMLHFLQLCDRLGLQVPLVKACPFFFSQVPLLIHKETISSDFQATLSHHSWYFPTLHPIVSCFLIRYLVSLLPLSLRLWNSRDQTLCTIIHVHICVCTCMYMCMHVCAHISIPSWYTEHKIFKKYVT